MGFLDWLGKHKSKPSVESRGQGRDPFHAYRKKKLLPEQFEYGMNCYFDRMAEDYGDEGKEIVQRAYEELKKKPENYRIEQDTSVTDVPGIPVLFAIRNIRVGLHAFNTAVRTIKYKRAPDDEFVSKQLERAIHSLHKVENESENEYVGRLLLTYMHLANLGFKFFKEGSILTAERLEPDSKQMKHIQTVLLEVAGQEDADALTSIACNPTILTRTARVLGIDIEMLEIPASFKILALGEERYLWSIDF